MHQAVNEALRAAIAHHERGELHKAEVLYRQILARRPDDPHALHGLGLLAHQARRHEDAIALLRRATAVQPGSAMMLNNLGEALRAAGRIDEAIECYRESLRIQPRSAEAHNNLALALRAKNSLDEAIEHLRRAVELSPSYVQAYSNLGLCLTAKGQVDDAIEILRTAVRLGPNFAPAHHNLGNTLEAAGRLEDATASYSKAVELAPDYAEPLNNLGGILERQDRLEKSIASYRRVVQIRPQWIEARANLSIVLQLAGRFDEARAEIEAAVKVAPDHPAARWNRALMLLTDGDFDRGWREYEWRWRQQRLPTPPLAWDGWESLEGKTMIVHAEQGFGDTIQFVRYALLLAERGVKVIVECQPELKTLLLRMSSISAVVARGEPLPSSDRRAAMLSLPLAFGTTLESIPSQVPYLSADAESVGRWRQKLAADGPASRRVGLAWAGRPTHPNDRRRSLTLKTLAPLARGAEGVAFYSLQKGEAAQQAQSPPPTIRLIDHTEHLRDFDDTAALVANLDLVICADTAVAHLAGALGRPVWVLLPFVGDWRWLRDREDSPWYPTMRLFRQDRSGDWQEVARRVTDELSSLR